MRGRPQLVAALFWKIKEITMKAAIYVCVNPEEQVTGEYVDPG
jgi:hypothetical protein